MNLNVGYMSGKSLMKVIIVIYRPYIKKNATIYLFIVNCMTTFFQKLLHRIVTILFYPNNAFYCDKTFPFILKPLTSIDHYYTALQYITTCTNVVNVTFVWLFNPNMTYFYEFIICLLKVQVG